MTVFANIFQPLIDVFESVLTFFHDSIGLTWGVSIIALTIVVRAAILPLTLRQMKSMRRLQTLSPKIKELQAKYKGDKQRQNEEMMKFYKENQVNPLGSCLPLLLQLPVFISLFYMLRIDLKKDICPPIVKYIAEQRPSGGIGAVSCTNGTNGQGVPKGAEVSFTQWLHLPAQAGTPKHFDTGFLFIPDLTAKATGAVLITLIVLYVGTQLASSLLMSITADRTQRLIFMALPFFFVIFIINFPAGLLVYWITTNTWTIVQQYVIRRTVGPIRPPLQPDGSPAPSPFAQLKEALSGATGGSGSGGGGGSGSGSGGGNSGKGNGAGSKADRQKVAAGAKAKGGGRGSSESSKPKPKRSGPPPASPRKKKKRSGRRR